MQAAVQTLAAMAGKGEKIAVLGDMFELGNASGREHRRLGKRWPKSVSTGSICSDGTPPSQGGGASRGMSEAKITIGEDQRAVARQLRAHVKKGDWILIKGSRGMRMEKILAALKIRTEETAVLYYILFSLHTTYTGFNVFRYITFAPPWRRCWRCSYHFLTGPWLIRALTRKQIGQQIRDDGPASHSVKAGTPTMGGALILLALTLATLLLADLANAYVWIALLGTVGFAPWDSRRLFEAF